jgi:CHAT domain-containing protein
MKQPAREEGRKLYDVLLRPITQAAKEETLVIIPDGPLHLVPFEGLVDESGRYFVEATPSYMIRRQLASIYSRRTSITHTPSHICS